MAMQEHQLVEALRSAGQLVRFHASTWTGSAKDNYAASELGASMDATGDAARVYKNLLANNDAELKLLKSAINAARGYFYKSTLEWGNYPGAPRLLPADQTMKFVKEMLGFKQKVADARAAFVETYPDRVAKARADLGKLADGVVYPPADEVANKFSLHYEFEPINSTRGFNGVEEKIASKLEEAAVANMQRRLAASVKTALEDVAAALDNVVLRMRAEKTRIHESLLENVERPVNLLRPFNVAGDEKLEALCQFIENNVTSYSVEALRNDDGPLREEVAERAEAAAGLVRQHMES